MFAKWVLALRSTMGISLRSLRAFLLFGCVAVSLSASSFGASVRETVFEAVWGEINANYYDPEFGGKDWEATGERYRERMSTVADEAEFTRLLSDLVQELGESHFSITSPSYNAVVANPWGGGDTGIRVTLVEGRAFVHRVRPGSPAESAGLEAGWELVSVAGEVISELRRSIADSGVFENMVPFYLKTAIESRLHGRPGEKVEVKVKRSRFATSKSMTLERVPYEGLMSEAIGNLSPTPMELETSLGDDGVARLRFTVWVPSVMGKVRAFIKSLPSQTRGLVIDVRGNPGGIGLMATGLAGMLVEEPYRMGAMQLRRGHLNFNVFPQKGAFLGPVAVLVDSNSISTSEIFAAAIQETSRGRVFGTRSAGAALPSAIKKLPNGYFLQMAIADYETTGGERIEGRGLAPDVEVALSPSDLLKGRDSVEEAARKWILRERADAPIKSVP